MFPRIFLASLLAVSACWVEPDPDPPSLRAPNATATPTADAGGAPSVTPLLVEVDTDRTLSAAPGGGVGVFVEYATGGKWHVWWTCDTAETGAACAFKLKIGGAALSSVASDGLLAGDSVVKQAADSLTATTTTGSNIVGVQFTTAPGAEVSVDATLGDVRDPAYFFFVQGGKPNGGYGGALTNPLRFRGTRP